jgi:pimeloyl-ACP methyl ester carboxylesterase
VAANGWALERGGVRLAGLDFGGAGPAALMLHGLAGHVGEWSETAAWLTGLRRVVAFDARGHGRSSRRPTDVSSDAHVDDAIFVVERLDLAPVVVIGQSLGGRTALLVAARRPDLVAGLVVAEASPEATRTTPRRSCGRRSSAGPCRSPRARRRSTSSAPRRGPTASSSATTAGGRASTSTSWS